MATDKVRRALRAQFSKNILIRNEIYDVFEFNAALIIDNWETIQQIDLLRPWIPTQLANQSRAMRNIPVPAGVMVIVHQ